MVLGDAASPLSTSPLRFTLQDNGPATPAPRRGVRRVVFVGMLTDSLLMTVIIPMMPLEFSCDVRAETQGCVPDAWIFILFASKPFMQVLANMLMGKIVDLWGPMATLRTSLLIMFFSTLGSAFSLWLNEGHADTARVVYPSLLVSRMLQGISSSGVATAGPALVNCNFPPDERGAAIGFVMIGVAIGVLTGPILGGFLQQFTSAAITFLIIAVMIAGGVVLQCALVGANTMIVADLERDDGRLGSYRVRSDPLVLIVAGCLLVGNGATSMMEPMVPLKLAKPPFGLKPGVQSLVWSIATVMYMVSTAISGSMGDKIPKWWLLILGMIFLACGSAVIFLVEELWVVMVGLALIGCSMGFLDTPAPPLLAEIVEFRGSSLYGRAAAVQDLATSVGFVLGPFIAALVGSKTNMEYATLGIAAAAVLMIFPVLKLSSALRQSH